MVVLEELCTQWRNVTIWCPPAHFFCRPTNFLLSPKKKENKKKGCHFFFGFSYRLLAPLELFVSPNIFSRRPNAKLAEIWYILLLCQKIFRLKNCKFGNMPPPCIAGVAGAVVTPLSVLRALIFLFISTRIVFSRFIAVFDCKFINNVE